jgi:hypothetical protein
MVDTRDIRLVIPDGHRYFAVGARIAVADRSGPTPETTDDGLLFLDTMRPVTFGSRECLVPLVAPDGETSWTPCSPYEAWQVVHVLGMDGRPVAAGAIA